ncbi:MAG: hypothetical protein LBT18_02825 [Endomicrobium sp.]|nr:hypothetical protein [Endomicrobium sp.]
MTVTMAKKMEGNNSKINVAFCFDENLWMQAGVAIYSLLHNSNDKCNYNIYCLVTERVLNEFRDVLKELVNKNSQISTITFINITSDFDNVNTTSWSKGVVYRLLLYKLLPDLEKIVYCDVDVVFTSDLCELNSIDVGNNYLAATIDYCPIPYNNELWRKYNLYELRNQKRYVNSGVLVMNLKKIREDELYKKWFELSKYSFPYPDQDMLNISCRDKIKYIDEKYNSTEKESVIIHYAGGENGKPWNRYISDATLDLDYVWWQYANATPFYITLLKKYIEYRINYRTPRFSKWIVLLMCCFIPSKNRRKYIRSKYAYEKIDSFIFKS